MLRASSLCNLIKNSNNLGHFKRFGTTKKVENVGVIGMGLMGHGIVQVAAQSGINVVAVETKKEFLDSGMKRIEGSLSKVASKAVEKKQISNEDAQAMVKKSLGRIKGTLDMKDLSKCDLVVEVKKEERNTKKKKRPHSFH